MTRKEFRELRRQLKETRAYVKYLHQQQSQLAEDADIWVRVARKEAEVALGRAKEARSEMKEKLSEVTDVFRVHRDPLKKSAWYCRRRRICGQMI